RTGPCCAAANYNNYPGNSFFMPCEGFFTPANAMLPRLHRSRGGAGGKGTAGHGHAVAPRRTACPMPESHATVRHALGLAALAVALVLAIVVGPFLVVRDAQRESVAAAAIVNHPHEVEATVQALMYALRNREAAAVAYASGVDSPAIRERL